METINVLKVDTQAAQTSIKELRRQLKQYKDEMAGLEEGSDAFNAVANKAGALQHQLSEINDTIRGASADFGDVLSNSLKVTNGIIGGFTAAQGALNAFGIESEEVGEAIKRLQGFMAIGQGVSQIDEATKAFAKLNVVMKLNNKSLGVFKKALIGTGLGALVVVLGSVIANWDEFSKSIGISTETLNRFGDIFKGVLNVVLKGIGGVGKAVSRLLTGDFEGALSAIKDGFSVVDNFNKGVAESVKEREEEIQKTEAKAAKERQDREEKERKDKEAKDKEAAEEAEKAAKEARQRAEDALDIRLEQNKRADLSDKERLQNEINIENERLALMEEGTLEYERQLTKIHDLQEKLNKPDEKLKVEEDPTAKRLREEADAYRESLKTQEELLSEKRALVQSYYEKGLIDEETYQTQMNQIAQQSAEANKQILQNKINASLDMADTFASLFSAIASNMDETNKKQFEAAKAFNIASATISTITGAIDAYMGAQANPAYQIVPGLAIAMGVIQAATVTAAGIAQIRKIASQKYEASSIGGSVSSTAVQSTVIPPVQYSQAVQGAQTERTISEQQTNTRVYVLESDIAKTTNKVNVAQSNATF